MSTEIIPPVVEPVPLYTAIRLQEKSLLNNPDAARKTLAHLLSEARKTQDKPSEAYILCMLGGAAFFQGNYNDTLLFAEYGLSLSQREGMPELEARCLNALGLAATRQGRYDEGLNYYRQSLNTARSIGDGVGHARALINMATAYSELEAHERALEMYQEGIKLADQHQALAYKAHAYWGLVEELRQLDRAEEAQELFAEALELAEMVDFRSMQWKLRYSEAMMALDERRLKDALHSTQQGLRIAQDTSDYEGLAAMRTLLGECLLNLADYDQALNELKKGERLAQAIGLSRVQSDAERLLAKLFENRGEALQALQHLKAHVDIEEQRRLASSHMRLRTSHGELLDEVQRHTQHLHHEHHQELTTTQQMLDQTRDELLHLSAHDALTGVHNRSSFWWLAQTYINETLDQDRPFFGLILADINELRAVNDLYGFAAGDAVLKEVSSRIQQVIDAQDIVGRLNGDEFMVLVTQPQTPEQLASLTGELARRVSAPVQYGDMWIETSVCVGYVAAPEDGQDLATLHRNTELALVAAKQSPEQAAARFDPTMISEEQLRRQLRAELPRALKNNQFTLHYQAQYSLHHQELTGFESLIRWEHPELGQISPKQFIALAEQSGKIIDLGTWILREACRQASQWSLPALGLSMAVNISPIQFSQPDFAELVQRVLAEFNLPGRCLTLEITEGLVHRDVEGSIATSHKLRALGVQVAMDDFGTGYSSLNILKVFPLDILKIDRTFMADLLPEHQNYERARQMMSAMITLAHTLDLRVIAEGVESLSQLRVLQELGCNKAQGYALAKPSTAPDVAFRLPPLPQKLAQ